jgi:uncharacterized protein YegL
MKGEPIDYLNQGLNAFDRQLKAIPVAARRIDVGLITFGNGGVCVAQEFVEARHFTPPVLQAGGDTPMGEAVQLAIQSLRSRKNDYRARGVPYYRPWLLLLTDGEPTDPDWQEAAAATKREEVQRALTCFPIGVGPQVNMAKLSQFSNKPPVSLNGLDFEDLFVWLSASLAKISASGPGDQVELPSIDTWGSVRG